MFQFGIPIGLREEGKIFLPKSSVALRNALVITFNLLAYLKSISKCGNVGLCNISDHVVLGSLKFQNKALF